MSTKTPKRKYPPKYQNVSAKKFREIIAQESGWDQLIAEGKLRILQMKRSITSWEEQRDNGVLFPLSEKPDVN